MNDMHVSKQPEMVRLILMKERPDSWNKYNTGVHWRKRKAEVDRVHQMVRAEIDPDEAFIFELPVHITITAWFKNRPLDSSNLYNKPYIDALVGWYIEDDDPKHVPLVTTGSFISKQRPRVEIEIRSIEPPPF